MQSFFVFFILLSLIVTLAYDSANAEEYNISIPFGAFNPELNTPAEVWYDPPFLSITVGDSVTWVNDDREGHTVTSGEGAGRFEWMGSKKLGEPDGLFDSGRFMPGESWTKKFDAEGQYRYFCIIQPWMEALIVVEPLIPDYPHDATGEKLEEFPIIQISPDQSVEINFSWDPKVIKTHEKVNFIYRFYDAINDQPLRKLQYDIIIIHNGKELYRDEGAVSGAGGDFRQWIFEEPGEVIVKFRNIQSFGTVGGMEISFTDNPLGRIFDFTAIVYDNPEKTVTTEKIVQPRETFQFYYEIAVLIIAIPGILLASVVFLMKRKNHTDTIPNRSSTPV